MLNNENFLPGQARALAFSVHVRVPWLHKIFQSLHKNTFLGMKIPIFRASIYWVPRYTW